MSKLEQAYRSVKKAYQTTERRYIDRALHSDRCSEHERYNNMVNRLMFFFSDVRTKGEMDRIGTSLQLAPSFTLERTQHEEGSEYVIYQTKESGPENGLDTSAPQQPPEQNRMHILYDADSNLAAINFERHGKTPISVERTGANSWTASHYSAQNIGAIGRAKQQYTESTRDILTFMADFYESVVLRTQGAEDTKGNELALYDRFMQTRKDEWKDRFGGLMTRADFLKRFGVLGLGVLSLVACNGQPGETPPQPSSFDLAPANADMKELYESGAFHGPLMEEVEKAHYEGLGDGAKEALYGYLMSKTAANKLDQGWRKITTPAFLRERGIIAGTELTEVFEFKNANGGVRYFDKTSNRYIKLSPVGSVDAKYLELAYKDTIAGWRAIGMPEEYIAAVQWADNFMVDGKPHVMMITPNVGNNMEGFVSMLRNGKNGGEAKVLALLENYYTKVLFPMNASGVIQQDLNFKNVTVLAQADGSVRFVPIDLAAHPKILEQNMVFQWQYEQLAERAARRKIAMPTFAEYLQSHPDMAAKVNVFDALAKEGIWKTSINIGNQCVHLYMPKSMVAGEATDKAMVTAIVDQIKQNYGAAYEKLPQGEVITVEVTLGDGTKKPLAFMKTNSIGGKIRPLGGKWGEALKLAKSGVKLASDALFVFWIASEVAAVTDPDYVAQIESSIAFPDTAVSTRKDNGIVFLDAMYDRLLLSKDNLAARATNLSRWDPIVESMTEMNNAEALSLITNFNVPHSHIIQYVSDMVRKAVVPPAPSEMRFQSPFPILIPGEEVPTTAYFSAFNNEGEKSLIFWAQVKNSNGETMTAPVSAFTKQQGMKDWIMTPIVDEPWSVQFSLTSLPLVYTCGTASSNGAKFELFCENK